MEFLSEVGADQGQQNSLDGAMKSVGDYKDESEPNLNRGNKAKSDERGTSGAKSRKRKRKHSDSSTSSSRSSRSSSSSSAGGEITMPVSKK